MASLQEENMLKEQISSSSQSDESSQRRAILNENNDIIRDEEKTIGEGIVLDNAPELSEQELVYAHYTGKNLVLVMISLMLVLFVASLDIIITATIIEKVAKRFGAYGKTGWLQTGYSLPTAVMILLISKISMALGVKFTLIACVVIFEIGSLVAGLANSMNMLIAGRVISGIGGAGIQNLVFVVISYIVEEKQRSMLVSILSCAFAIASVVGPFLGGAFTRMSHQPNWRMCFYINLPIGGIAVIIFYFMYNHKGSEFPYDIKKFNPKVFTQKKFYKKIFKGAIFQFDMINFTLCTTGLVLFLIGLTYGGDESYKWTSGTVIAMLTIGGFLFISAFIWDFFFFENFCKRYNQVATPLVDRLVFKNFSLFSINAVAFLMSSAYMAEILYIIQYFQLIFGNTAWTAAVHLIATLIACTIVVIFCGVFIKKTGQVKLIICVANAIGVVAAGLLPLLKPDANSAQKIGLLILPGVAFGGIVQTTMVGCQVFVDKSSPQFKAQLTSLISFYSFVKLLGMAFVSILATMVFDVSLHNRVQASSELSYLHNFNVNELITYRLTYFDGKDSAFGKALSDSAHVVFWMALGIASGSLLFCPFLSNKKTDHGK